MTAGGVEEISTAAMFAGGESVLESSARNSSIARWYPVLTGILVA